ncbi:MAG: hypothetical protein K0S79_86 [Nitrospira sp.]|jgi:hypothetical protein|nr:hypothetical protein [Nitrospira sp.]
MHEHSRTRPVAQSYFQNVHGAEMEHTPGVTFRPGDPLRPQFPWEMNLYPTEEQAGNAARRRSQVFGQMVDDAMNRHAEMDQYGPIRRRLMEGLR